MNIFGGGKTSVITISSAKIAFELSSKISTNFLPPKAMVVTSAVPIFFMIDIRDVPCDSSEVRDVN